MSITNVSKPSSSYTNVDRTPVGETWATIDTTWANETRTWSEIGSFIDNTSKGLTGFLWSAWRLPWQETAPWSTEYGITNVTKP